MSDLKLLDGVKVVDMSAFVAAPMAAEILAEYGADVVRIEPLTGDGIRGWGMTQNIYNGDAPLYDAINGNKRHIAVNTRTAEGMGVLWKLLETADIFICHMREKDMVKLGIDWDTLHAKFPALIYANTTGYGSTGPLASRGGFDMIAYATRTGLTTDVVPEGAHPYMPYQAHHGRVHQPPAHGPGRPGVVQPVRLRHDERDGAHPLRPEALQQPVAEGPRERPSVLLHVPRLGRPLDHGCRPAVA